MPQHCPKSQTPLHESPEGTVNTKAKKNSKSNCYLSVSWTRSQNARGGRWINQLEYVVEVCRLWNPPSPLQPKPK